MENKIDKRKKYYLVLDVETTGGLGNPLIYDLGFAICDKKGNIYEKRSFIIKEIFDNKRLMDTAYYVEKVPRYVKDLENGKRKKVSFLEAREELIRVMEKYGSNTICAYNLAFDRRALTSTTERLFGTGKKFLPPQFKGIEQLCIWSFACEVIYTRPSFWKVAEEQKWFTENGNMRTSAEIGHRYLSTNYQFEESHTGLEDVEIEVSILAKCFQQHKKHESGIISHPWRIPNNAKKERE